MRADGHSVSARMSTVKTGVGGRLGAPHAGGVIGLAKVVAPPAEHLTSHSVAFELPRRSGPSGEGDVTLHSAVASRAAPHPTAEPPSQMMPLARAGSGEFIARKSGAEPQRASRAAASASPSPNEGGGSGHYVSVRDGSAGGFGAVSRSSAASEDASRPARRGSAGQSSGAATSLSSGGSQQLVKSASHGGGLGVDAATVGIPVSIPINMMGLSSASDSQRQRQIVNGAIPMTNVQASLQKEGKLVLAMVGLPARGKTFMARRLKRHLSWIGYKTDIYNVGNFRRRILGATQPAQFFDPSNTAGEQARREMANIAFEEMVEALANDVS